LGVDPPKPTRFWGSMNQTTPTAAAGRNPPGLCGRWGTLSTTGSLPLGRWGVHTSMAERNPLGRWGYTLIGRCGVHTSAAKGTLDGRRGVHSERTLASECTPQWRRAASWPLRCALRETLSRWVHSSTAKSCLPAVESMNLNGQGDFPQPMRVHTLNGRENSSPPLRCLGQPPVCSDRHIPSTEHPYPCAAGESGESACRQIIDACKLQHGSSEKISFELALSYWLHLNDHCLRTNEILGSKIGIFFLFRL
jgi:hypothetical protein